MRTSSARAQDGVTSPNTQAAAKNAQAVVVHATPTTGWGRPQNEQQAAWWKRTQTAPNPTGPAPVTAVIKAKDSSSKASKYADQPAPVPDRMPTIEVVVPPPPQRMDNRERARLEAERKRWEDSVVLGKSESGQQVSSPHRHPSRMRGRVSSSGDVPGASPADAGASPGPARFSSPNRDSDSTGQNRFSSPQQQNNTGTQGRFSSPQQQHHQQASSLSQERFSSPQQAGTATAQQRFSSPSRTGRFSSPQRTNSGTLIDLYANVQTTPERFNSPQRRQQGAPPASSAPDHTKITTSALPNSILDSNSMSSTFLPIGPALVIPTPTAMLPVLEGRHAGGVSRESSHAYAAVSASQQQQQQQSPPSSNPFQALISSERAKTSGPTPAGTKTSSLGFIDHAVHAAQPSMDMAALLGTNTSARSESQKDSGRILLRNGSDVSHMSSQSHMSSTVDTHRPLVQYMPAPSEGSTVSSIPLTDNPQPTNTPHSHADTDLHQLHDFIDGYQAMVTQHERHQSDMSGVSTIVDSPHRAPAHHGRLPSDMSGLSNASDFQPRPPVHHNRQTSDMSGISSISADTAPRPPTGAPQAHHHRLHSDVSQLSSMLDSHSKPPVRHGRPGSEISPRSMLMDSQKQTGSTVHMPNLESVTLTSITSSVRMAGYEQQSHNGALLAGQTFHSDLSSVVNGRQYMPEPFPASSSPGAGVVLGPGGGHPGHVLGSQPTSNNPFRQGVTAVPVAGMAGSSFSGVTSSSLQAAVAHPGLPGVFHVDLPGQMTARTVATTEIIKVTEWSPFGESYEGSQAMLDARAEVLPISSPFQQVAEAANAEHSMSQHDSPEHSTDTIQKDKQGKPSRLQASPKSKVSGLTKGSLDQLQGGSNGSFGRIATVTAGSGKVNEDPISAWIRTGSYKSSPSPSSQIPLNTEQSLESMVADLKVAPSNSGNLLPPARQPQSPVAPYRPKTQGVRPTDDRKLRKAVSDSLEIESQPSTGWKSTAQAAAEAQLQKAIGQMGHGVHPSAYEANGGVGDNGESERPAGASYQKQHSDGVAQVRESPDPAAYKAQRSISAPQELNMDEHLPVHEKGEAFQIFNNALAGDEQDGNGAFRAHLMHRYLVDSDKYANTNPDTARSLVKLKSVTDAASDAPAHTKNKQRIPPGVPAIEYASDFKTGHNMSLAMLANVQNSYDGYQAPSGMSSPLEVYPLQSSIPTKGLGIASHVAQAVKQGIEESADHSMDSYNPLPAPRKGHGGPGKSTEDMLSHLRFISAATNKQGAGISDAVASAVAAGQKSPSLSPTMKAADASVGSMNSTDLAPITPPRAQGNTITRIDSNLTGVTDFQPSPQMSPGRPHHNTLEAVAEVGLESQEAHAMTYGKDRDGKSWSRHGSLRGGTGADSSERATHNSQSESAEHRHNRSASDGSEGSSKAVRETGDAQTTKHQMPGHKKQRSGGQGELKGSRYSRSSNMNPSSADNAQQETSTTTVIAHIVTSGSNVKLSQIDPPTTAQQQTVPKRHKRRTSSDSTASECESVASSSGSSHSSVNKPVKSSKPTDRDVRHEISSPKPAASKAQGTKESASSKAKDSSKGATDKHDKLEKPKKDKSGKDKVKRDKASGEKVKSEKVGDDKGSGDKAHVDKANRDKPINDKVKADSDKAKKEKPRLEKVRSSHDKTAVPSPTAAASPQHAKHAAPHAEVDKHTSPSPKASGTPHHPSKEPKDQNVSRSKSYKDLHISQPSPTGKSHAVLSPTATASPKTKQSASNNSKAHTSSSDSKAAASGKESTSQPGTPLKDSRSFTGKSQPTTPTKAAEGGTPPTKAAPATGDVTITIASPVEAGQLTKQDSAEASTTLGLTQTFMTTNDIESGMAAQTSAELQANALALDQHVKRFGQGPIRAGALPDQLRPPALVRRADQRPRPRTFDDASVCSLEFTITSMSDVDMSMPGKSRRHRRKHSHSTVLTATLEGAAPLHSARDRRSRRNPKQPALMPPSFNPGNERMAQFFAPSVVDDDESIGHTMSTMDGFMMGTQTEGLYGPALSTIQTVPFVEQATQLHTVWEPYKPSLSKNQLRKIFPLQRVNWHAFRFWHVLWVLYIPLGLAILLLRLMIIALMLFCFGSSTGDGNSMISHFLFLAGIGTRVRFQWEKPGHSRDPAKVEKFWEAVGKETSVVFAMEHHGSPIEMLGFLDIVPLQLVSGAGRRLLGSLIGPTVYYGHGQSGRSPSVTELNRNPSISKMSQGRMAAVPSVRREDSTNKATATRALIVCPQGVPSSTHTVINFVGDVFQAKDTIHPVAVDHRLPLPLNPCTLTSSRWSDLVWMLFQPWQVVEYTILEPAPVGLSTDSVAKWCQQQVVKYSRMPKKLMDVSHEDWEWLIDNVAHNVG